MKLINAAVAVRGKTTVMLNCNGCLGSHVCAALLEMSGIFRVCLFWGQSLNDAATWDGFG